MKAKGVLYTVEGPRGVYYAIHDPATGKVWTERTESAAVAQARDLGILLVAEEVVTSDELLRRTGRDRPDPVVTARVSESHKSHSANPPLQPPESELDVAPPAIPGSSEDEPIVFSRFDLGGACFATDLPLGITSSEDPFEHLPPAPPLEGFARFHSEPIDPKPQDF